MISADVWRQKFTAKERDNESGLDYFLARYYSGAQGRFTSTDLVNLTAKRLVNPTNTLNKYIYAGNNPNLYVDPTGLDMTVFYHAPNGRSKDFGHIFLAVTNQATSAVRFADYYPEGGNKRTYGPATGEINQRETSEQLKDHAALTIKTTPEIAQKLINAIDSLSKTIPNYWMLTNTCATLTADLLSLADIEVPSLLASPTDIWSVLYGDYSSEAITGGPLKMGLFRYKTGKDFGSPMNVFPQGTDPFYNLELLSLLLQNQSELKTETITITDSASGTKTTWVNGEER